MGTEESVPVLRKGDICKDKWGHLWKVLGDEFPYEHESWVNITDLRFSYPQSRKYWVTSFRTSLPTKALTRIDPAFYKLLDIEE